MKTLLLVVLAVFAISNANASDLSIGVKHAKPFAYKEDGIWKGLSIDLLEQLSLELNFVYSLHEQPTVNDLVLDTKNNVVDMAVAAISLTPERESVIDFTHSYFNTSQGILAKTKATPLENLLWISQRVGLVLLALIASMYAMGFLISRVDKGGNINGAHEGAWWALVTFSTTGYGDEVPVTNGGKIVASVWIIASLFLISIFTGYISSAMTVKKLSESTTKLADLYNANVTVVAGTTAEFKLANLGIAYHAVDNLDVAMNKFKSGKTSVVVYDKAMLDYESRGMENIAVLPIDNSVESYAIIMPQGSALKEQINVAILKILSTPTWKITKAKYFGAE